MLLGDPGLGACGENDEAKAAGRSGSKWPGTVS